MYGGFAGAALASWLTICGLTAPDLILCLLQFIAMTGGGAGCGLAGGLVVAYGGPKRVLENVLGLNRGGTPPQADSRDVLLGCCLIFFLDVMGSFVGAFIPCIMPVFRMVESPLVGWAESAFVAWVASALVGGLTGMAAAFLLLRPMLTAATFRRSIG